MTSIVKIMPKRDKRPKLENRLVVALAYNGLCTFEFGVAVEVFGLARPEMGQDWYRFAVAGVDPNPMRAAGGVQLIVDGGLELLDEAGTIIVPGWRGVDAPVGKELKNALRRAHARGARILSICSGAFVLAAAGLLDDRAATTHWRYLDILVQRYPKIRIERDVLYVDDGLVFTSAGSAAGIDLCLHLVRRDFGLNAANIVARRLVVPPHREGGQAQFVEQPVPPVREGARLSPLIDSLRQRLDEPLLIARLATEAAMSKRTFLRRFKSATGTAPGEWLVQARVRRACELLETTKQSMDEVARVCGFAQPGAMRHHFRQRVGLSPLEYRLRFGSQNGM